MSNQPTITTEQELARRIVVLLEDGIDLVIDSQGRDRTHSALPNAVIDLRGALTEARVLLERLRNK